MHVKNIKYNQKYYTGEKYRVSNVISCGIMYEDVQCSLCTDGEENIMAKYERSVKGNFFEIKEKIKNGILGGSISASLEDSSYFCSGDAKCCVLVFERYSYAGGNRVSMNVTLFQNAEEDIMVSAITSGGSQAMFFKMNTWGEEAFLDKLREII